MLRYHARNGNEFQTPGHRWLPAKHWDAWFLNSSKSKTRLKFMKLGMVSWSGINMPWYKFWTIWGQVWVYASHEPELLTTSMMVFGRERPTFGDETISIASYCFQIFFSCQHRTTGVLCEFLWCLGLIWTFLCIIWVLNAFYLQNSNLNSMHMLQCIWIGWKIKSMSLCACLGPMQEMGMNFKHRGTVDCRQNIEMPGFKF